MQVVHLGQEPQLYCWRSPVGSEVDFAAESGRFRRLLFFELLEKIPEFGREVDSLVQGRFFHRV